MDGVCLQRQVFKKEKWYLVCTIHDFVGKVECDVHSGTTDTKILVQIIEYRGVKVRRSVADLREASYRSQGKDCYVSSDCLLTFNIIRCF